VAALLHLVDTDTRGERGITVLDAGGKEKRGGRMHLRYDQAVQQRMVGSAAS
jgi:hypothetical protein